MSSHIDMDGKINREQYSFTFVRMSLAVLVILTHCYKLGGFGQEPLLTFSHSQNSYGSLAVDCFFIISGLFVSQSFIASRSVWRYLWKRMLRIFPGYWVCLVATAFVIGFVVYYFEQGNLHYFKTARDNPMDYVKANVFLMIKQRGIANLFATNPYSIDFNGSLWILKYQVLCYLSLALIGVKVISKYRKQVFLVLFLLFWLTNIFEKEIVLMLSNVLPEARVLRVPNFYVYFLSGALFFSWMERIPLNGILFMCSVILTALGLRAGLYSLLAPLTLPYILVYLARKLPLSKLNKWGDYSYGIYIYAFPIQQTLVFFGLNKYGIVWYFTLSLLITLPLAIMSWWFVEKPCLGLKAVGVHSLMSVPLTLQKTQIEK